jgi:hypothetical protein
MSFVEGENSRIINGATATEERRKREREKKEREEGSGMHWWDPIIKSCQTDRCDSKEADLKKIIRFIFWNIFLKMPKYGKKIVITVPHTPKTASGRHRQHVIRTGHESIPMSALKKNHSDGTYQS